MEDPVVTTLTVGLTSRKQARALCLGAALFLIGVPRAPAAVQFLEGDCEGEFSLRTEAKVAGKVGNGDAAELMFHYADERNYCALKVAGNALTLARVENGKAIGLGSAPVRLTGGAHLLTVQRRQWRVNVVWDDETVIQAYDAGSAAGKAGTQNLGAGIKLESAKLQPWEPVYYTDDFARAANSGELWKTLAGKWGLEEIKGAFGSNRFSWRSQGEGPNLCSSGYWFWDSYKCEASVHPSGATSIGVAAFVRDKANHLLVRWTVRTSDQVGEKQLVAVRGGRETVLATKPGGYVANQWHSVRIVATGGRVHGSFDGRPELSADCELFGEGEIGLFAEGTAQFDDVRAEAADGFRELFGSPGPRELKEVGAGWTAKKGGDWAVYTKSAPGTGVSVLGRADWRDYVYGADVKPGGSAASGIVFGFVDEKNYEALLCTAGGLRHVRVREGNETVVGECPLQLDTGAWQRLKVDLERGVARCYLNDELKLVSAIHAELAGQVGFRADGNPGASFDNLVVWFHEAPTDTAVVFEQFTKEETMNSWANPAYAWREAGGVYWHLGEFFADARVDAQLAAVNSGQGSLQLCCDGQQPNTGYTLAVTREQGKAKFALLRQQQPVATGEAPAAEPARLSFYREGGLVAATVDDEPVVSYYDPQPLSGRRVALAPGGGLGTGTAAADTTHLFDDTFGRAPINWWGARGDWQVTPRWPCDDRWTFFGGLQSDAPMLWSRRKFDGDVVFEAWLAQYMDNSDDPQIGYRHLGNLDLAICGDGRDVSSGYSFVYAGKDNTVVRIMRKGQVVAEEKRPEIMVKAMRLNVPWQRHWFHLRVEKRGGNLRLFADDKLWLKYTDPDPLPGGQVAAWGYRNGLMIARARVWYEKDAGEGEPPVLLEQVSPVEGQWQVDAKQLGLVSDFERNTNGWAPVPSAEAMQVQLAPAGASGRCLKVTAPFSGGDMVVMAGLKEFDPLKLGKLSFDYKLDPQAKVNLYAKFGADYHVVLFSAPESPGEARPGTPAKPLGKLDNVVADNQWHHAEFDLAAAVQAAFPNRPDIRAANLSFAGPRDAEYLRAGFGGNYFGTSFCVDNVRLAAAPGTTVEELKAVAGAG